MELQTVMVFVIVALAAVYVLRGTWNSVTGGGCDTGCGKCAEPKAELIQLGVRKTP